MSAKKGFERHFEIWPVIVGTESSLEIPLRDKEGNPVASPSITDIYDEIVLTAHTQSADATKPLLAIKRSEKPGQFEVDLTDTSNPTLRITLLPTDTSEFYTKSLPIIADFEVRALNLKPAYQATYPAVIVLDTGIFNLQTGVVI